MKVVASQGVKAILSSAGQSELGHVPIGSYALAELWTRKALFGVFEGGAPPQIACDLRASGLEQKFFGSGGPFGKEWAEAQNSPAISVVGSPPPEGGVCVGQCRGPVGGGSLKWWTGPLSNEE